MHSIPHELDIKYIQIQKSQTHWSLNAPDPREELISDTVYLVLRVQLVSDSITHITALKPTA